MANIQMNTQIIKAITSEACFTRVDEIKQNIQNKEIIRERLKKFDSPNNVKGVFITTRGIYVENYNGYATIDSNSNKKVKHIGNRIHFDKEVNKQWSEAVQASIKTGEPLNIEISNNWMFDPVLSNLRYIYFDEIISLLYGHVINDQNTAQSLLYEAVVKAKGAKGIPNRQTFQKLRYLMYIRNLGSLFESPNGVQNIQKIQMSYTENWGINLANEPSIQAQYAVVDLNKVNGWGPAQTDVQARPDVYMYDKVFLTHVIDKQKAAKDEAEQKRKEAEQKDKKEGYGIPGFLAVKDEFEDIIKDYLVNPVVETYRTLLEIGYGGPKQNDGILTREQGWIYLGSDKRIKAPDKKVRFKGQTIWQAVEYGLKNQGKRFRSIDGKVDVSAQTDEIPDMAGYIENLAKMQNSGSGIISINYGFNIRLIKGYTTNCKIPAKYKDEMLNDSKQKIVNWAGVQFYISNALIDMTVAALIKNNVINVSEQQRAGEFKENNKVKDYCIFLREAFCNGVYLQNQYQLDNDRELLQTSVRICVPKGINLDMLMEDIRSQIPNSVEVKTKKHGDNNSSYSMLYFIVKYSEDANKTMIPATKALEAIMESGELPSWSHALLGEKDDETPFYWNQFMGSDNTPFKRAYSIYAGSRSGKGILTNTLLCNAIANQYKVFYVDGKPDTGISLGNIAWSKGKEAFVFDGMRAGSGEHSPGQLEKYSHGLRNPNEWASGFNAIPAGLKQYSDLIQTVTTYYRCIELIFNIISYRAGEGKGQLGSPDKDWCVFVIDECAKMADKEKTLRGMFKNFVLTSGAKKIQGTFLPYKPENVKDQSKVVWSDELQFIRNWMMWMQNIESSVNTAVTMNLGPSQQNVFLIFQGSNWMQDAKDTTMVRGLMQLPTTKIMGRGAIENGASSAYGNAATSKFPWADYINQPLSWVITTKQNVNSCEKEEDVRKFRPYSLWGNTENQMLYHEPDTYRNIQYYIRKLEETFDFDAASVLESAYTYADKYTKYHSKLNIKQYVYGLDFLNQVGPSNEQQESEDIPIENWEEQNIDDDLDEEPQNAEDELSIEDNLEEDYIDNDMSYSQFADDDHYGTSLIEQRAQQKNTEEFEQAEMIEPGYTKNKGGNYILDESYESTEVLNNDNARKAAKSQSLFEKWVRSKMPTNPVGKDGIFQTVQYDLMIGGQILYEIQRAAGSSWKVIDLGLINNRVYVNKKMLSFADEMTNPQGEIDLPNCIKFKQVFKKFKRMQHLQIDSEMYDELLNEYESYGKDRLRQVFKESKKLIDIKIFDRSGRAKIIQRSKALRKDFKDSDERQVQLAIRSNDKKTRDQMKSSGFFSRAAQLFRGIKEEAWGTPTKRALTAVTTITTVGFLGLAAGPIVLLGTQLFANFFVRKLQGSIGTN